MAINQSVLGPQVTAQDQTRWNLVAVSLVNTTAKVWTHNVGRTPTGILVFKATGELCLTTQPAVVSNTTAITLTPTASIDVVVLIMWAIPTQMVFGIASSNFA